MIGASDGVCKSRQSLVRSRIFTNSSTIDVTSFPIHCKIGLPNDTHNRVGASASVNNVELIVSNNTVKCGVEDANTIENVKSAKMNNVDQQSVDIDTPIVKVLKRVT